MACLHLSYKLCYTFPLLPFLLFILIFLLLLLFLKPCLAFFTSQSGENSLLTSPSVHVTCDGEPAGRA